MLIGQKQQAGQFSYYTDGSRSNPVSYIFARDLNGDGVEEVIFAAFETQPNIPSQYSNTSVHIFGWKDNAFQNLTQQWLPNNTNLVEGVGDLAFGDFNGDGLVDIFLSAYTDMNHPVYAYQLLNRGGVFEVVSLGLETWMHAVAAGDINRDGYDDVIAAGYSNFPQYLGSPTGLQAYRGMVGSSGLAVGDFLGDGTLSAIFVDAGTGAQDTFLYRFVINEASKSIDLQKVSTLPAPRLFTLGLESTLSSSHDIRARSFDFNHDGLLDVLVFSYLANYSNLLTQNEHKSEIQFLLNRGNGEFVDVTEQYRINYDVSGYVGYYPQIVDVNLDGLLDVFTSQPDWMPRYNSTTLLLQQDGKFIDSNRNTINNNIESIGASQSIVVRGPNQEMHLVSESAWSWSDPITKIYIQDLLFPERELGELLIGTQIADRIYGLGGNDIITGGGGNDTIDGGSGIDTAIYTGTAASYALSLQVNGISSTTIADLTANRDGTDTLISIERLQFSDINVAIDIAPNDNAGSVYMLYKAAFNRIPETEGMGYWLAQKDGGANIVTSIAQGFVNSAEFIAKYGANPSNSSYVNNLYQNVLGRAGEAGGVAYWIGEMDAGRVSKAQALVQFATLPEGAQLVAPLIANGIQYQEWVG